MNPDVLAGHGAFRCGCGARVTVTVAIPATCTGMADSGERCRTLPIRESAQFGVALCYAHYHDYLDMLDLIKEGERAWERIELLNKIAAPGVQRQQQEWQEYRQRCEEQAVVYYVRMLGGLIKIGTTTNMKARMEAFIIEEVLATEPGGRDLEKERHAQFAHLKVRGERFSAGEDLLSHIEAIREQHGEPNMTGRVPDTTSRRPPLDRSRRSGDATEA
jgi:hypothetical protein